MQKRQGARAGMNIKIWLRIFEYLEMDDFGYWPIGMLCYALYVYNINIMDAESAV